MLEQSIQELLSRSLERIESAQSPAELEAVRVEALGRKGALAGFSKEMSKLAPEERKRIGMVLNEAKQRLESAYERREGSFSDAALRARAPRCLKLSALSNSGACAPRRTWWGRAPIVISRCRLTYAAIIFRG